MNADIVLITGGAGFIGTALAAKLRQIHYKILLLDLPGKFTMYHRQLAPCIEADIRDYETLRCIHNQNIKYIFHLAAQTSGVISQEQPELDVDTNIKGTLNICRLARELKVHKIIFSSSMAVYGDSKYPLREIDPLLPKSVYGSSKVSAETFIKMYKQYGIDYTIFRFFNVYGPGQDMTNMRQGMASIFMTQIILGNTIKVTGSLNRYRDFVYIDDVIDALIMSLSGLDTEVYNVGKGQKTTVKDLIHLLIKIKGIPEDRVNIENIGGHDGDQIGTFSCCEKLRKKGWEQKTILETGLRMMYIYAKEVLR